MATNKRNTNDWVEAIASVNDSTGNTPPGEGWKTFHELHDELKIGNNKLRRLLTVGMEDGTFEHYEGTKTNATGRICRSVWYRPIKLAK